MSSANSISFIFENCRSFNQPLNNYTSTITDMRGAFKDTHNFNQPLDNWDVSNVRRMDDMFHDARIFNENIDNWDVSMLPICMKCLKMLVLIEIFLDGQQQV